MIRSLSPGTLPGSVAPGAQPEGPVVPSHRPVNLSERPRRRSEHAGPRLLDLTGKERHLRAALHAMGLVAQNFCRAARRTLPFLVRRRARLVPAAVAISDAFSYSDTAPELSFEVRLEDHDSPAWGRLTVDPRALGLLLDGALGGDSSDVSALDADLTLAQAALVGRIARSLADDLCTAVEEEVGLGMKVVSSRCLRAGEHLDAPDTDGLSVNCLFEGIGDGAAIRIAVSAEVLEAAVREQNGEDEPVAGDPRMADAIQEVPLEVVAVLGTLTLGLRQVLTLHTGQVLRLPAAVDDPVTVRVAGLPKFWAVPVVSRGQIGVRVHGRHEE